MTTAVELNKLISSSYSTVLDQQAWQDFLPAVAQAFDSDLACVMIQNSGSGNGGGLYNFGIDDSDVALYGNHFGPRSELFSKFSTSPAGTK